MKAGRELDALVAEKVFGWGWYTIVGINVMLPPDHTYRNSPVLAQPGKNGHEDDIDSDRFYDSRRGGRTMPIVPPYSTDIAAAWSVVQKLQEGRSKDFVRIVTVHDFWLGYAECEIASEPEGGSKPRERWPRVFADGETPSHAICLAALVVCGVALQTEQTPPKTP